MFVDDAHGFLRQLSVPHMNVEFNCALDETQVMPTTCRAPHGSVDVHSALHGMAVPSGVFPEGETLIEPDIEKNRMPVRWLSVSFIPRLSG